MTRRGSSSHKSIPWRTSWRIGGWWGGPSSGAARWISLCLVEPVGCAAVLVPRSRTCGLNARSARRSGHSERVKDSVRSMRTCAAILDARVRAAREMRACLAAPVGGRIPNHGCVGRGLRPITAIFSRATARVRINETAISGYALWLPFSPRNILSPANPRGKPPSQGYMPLPGMASGALAGLIPRSRGFRPATLDGVISGEPGSAKGNPGDRRPPGWLGT
jgi:hypothetical protein